MLSNSNPKNINTEDNFFVDLYEGFNLNEVLANRNINSKLNETARSYKMISEESKQVEGFEFVWFTDGMGWISARNNLKETFHNMEHIYNINDLNNGIIKNIIK